MNDNSQNDIAATGALIESLERIEDIRFLLRKLAEECIELAHIALKTEQFGPHESYPEGDRDNLQRLQHEFCDVLAIISMLEEKGIGLRSPSEKERGKKRNKVHHFREYSKMCTQEPELWETSDG